MMDQYIYSESHVSENYNKTMQVDDILKLAGTIWSEIKSDPDFKNESKLDSIFEKYYKKYHDFGTGFPIILRWMVYLERYSEKSFKKFLKKYSTTNITSKKDFLILQAEYLVYLYEENKHYDRKQINTYREFIIKQLLEEEELHKKMEEEAKEEINKMNMAKRKRLYEYLISSIK